jgi:GNAT superfamily N-acetyltransferase
MTVYESTRDNFFISTDKEKLDVKTIHAYLSQESYWAKNIPLSVVQRSIEHSYCFGVYMRNENETTFFLQIGFARVITDQATFGYLADVFINEKYRGLGLSKWLMETIMGCQDLQGLRSWMLATKDAHFLYEKFGFKIIDNPGRFMRLGMFQQYPEIEGGPQATDNN